MGAKRRGQRMLKPELGRCLPMSGRRRLAMVEWLANLGWGPARLASARAPADAHVLRWPRPIRLGPVGSRHETSIACTWRQLRPASTQGGKSSGEWVGEWVSGCVDLSTGCGLWVKDKASWPSSVREVDKARSRHNKRSLSSLRFNSSSWLHNHW